MTSTETLSKSDFTKVSMKRSVLKVAKQKATQQNRSVSNYVENLILNDKNSGTYTTETSSVT